MKLNNRKFPVAMRPGDTPVPIPNTMVKTWAAEDVYKRQGIGRRYCRSEGTQRGSGQKADRSDHEDLEQERQNDHRNIFSGGDTGIWKNAWETGEAGTGIYLDRGSWCGKDGAYPGDRAGAWYYRTDLQLSLIHIWFWISMRRALRKELETL